MDSTSSSLIQTEPMLNPVLQGLNRKDVAATNTSISSSLKLRIAKELFASSKLKQKTLNGHVSGKSESAMRKSDRESRKTTRTSSPTPQTMHSGSLNRPKKLMNNPLAEFSSEQEGDFELALETASLHSTPTQMPSYSHTKRSCLKKYGAVGPTKRAPPVRSSSADQLNFQVLLPGQRKPVTRTRSITFDESVRVRRVPSISELSKGRNNEIWFQPQEYETIKRKTYTLIQAIQHGQTGGVNYCTRGLEKYFEAEKVQRTRNAARDSVLVVQEGQRRKGSFDDLQMSQAYRTISTQSMAEAAFRGKRDQESIERYQLKTKHLLRSHSYATIATVATR
jgi:hypothetical protein